MKKYYNSLDNNIKEYFKILSPEFPEWLNEYINTPAMLRLHDISIDCGCDYTDLFPKHQYYSTLDHSVGVALIVWNFTKDKKQTLAGLFHDIATPVFKHCIDFMNGDSETQESTEERTTEIIKNSKEIMELLTRDNILVEEVDDYKLYPIADNEGQRLSADRFEYNFAGSLFTRPVWNVQDIKECYEDIIIVKNEEGIDELAFTHLNIAEKYISAVSKVWPWWINDEDRISMQFIADICKSLNNLGYLSINDLYTLSEEKVIKKFKTCDKYIADAFSKFEKTTKCYTSDVFVKDKYCVNIKSKRRYINALVLVNNKPQRMYNASDIIKKIIDDFMKVPVDGITYFDFNFKPVERKNYE